MSDESKRVVELGNLGPLSSERGEFVEIFFRKGAEFASELIIELETLKKEHDRLIKENTELKHHLASDNAIRDLLTKIETLEKEKKNLITYINKDEEETRNFTKRYAEVERELNNMASLYVALYQLHARLEPREVLGVIEQLLAQFVGAGSFVIYLSRENKEGKTLVPVHAYHCQETAGKQIPWNEGPIGEAAATGVYSVADPKTAKSGEPLACIPMISGEDVVGVIAILGFFEQKEEFVEIDFEFFKLLSIHSASAVVAAGLMYRASSLSLGLDQYERL